MVALLLTLILSQDAEAEMRAAKDNASSAMATADVEKTRAESSRLRYNTLRAQHDPIDGLETQEQLAAGDYALGCTYRDNALTYYQHGLMLEAQGAMMAIFSPNAAVYYFARASEMYLESQRKGQNAAICFARATVLWDSLCSWYE